MMNRTDFFDVIDSEETAYWMGFLCADGHVSKNKKYISVQLSTKDQSHLQKFATIFDRPVFIGSAFDRRTEKTYDWGRVVLYSTHMNSQFVNKGVTPQKSLTLSSEIFSHIPKPLLHHFVRGYFDGDGCITFVGKSTEVRLIICGTEIFLKRMSEVIPTSSFIREAGKIVQLLITSIPQVITFREWLYNDATIYLERKWTRFNSVGQRGSSQYTGVHWCSTKKRWLAKFRKAGKNHYVGSFHTAEEASKARDNTIKELENASQ